MLLLGTCVQAAVWWQATQVAQAAAGRALEAARAEHGTPAAARAAALTVITQAGGHVLTDPQVSITRDGDRDRARITVTVTGTATAVLPGLRPPIRAVAAGPAEEFTPPATGPGPGGGPPRPGGRR
jgi:hypothetical protein